MIQIPTDLKKTESILKVSGIDTTNFTPDGKLHTMEDGSYYVGFQLFSEKTTSAFYLVLYACKGWDAPEEYCSLENPGVVDKFAINIKLKAARRLIGLGEDVQEVALPSGSVYPLGFRGSSYFLTSTHNRQVVQIDSFSEKDFLHLMPLEYWQMYAPGQSGVSWSRAKSQIMVECRARGIFETKNIRGAGVWKDKERVVVNMGDHLVVDGEKMNLEEIKSEFFYTLGVKLPDLHPNPLTLEEVQTVREAAETFKWKNSDFGILVAGAMVTTRLCGALPIRPHLWVTGEKGSGKTTLFNRYIYPLIGEPLLFLAGNSTEAGIRQEVSTNAIPVLFDEFENSGQKSAEIVQSTVDLMRVAWSETQAVILKGSASGVAQSYRVRFAAIVTSIRQISLSDADQSRFATVELAPHGSDMEHWAHLESLLDKIDMEFGNRLFARTIKMLPILMQNFKEIKKAFNKKSPGQRFGDQYGMLLAGYSTLLWDEAIGDIEAETIVDLVKLGDAREAASVSDQEDCLTKVLTKSVKIGEVDISIADAILSASTDSIARKYLERYGIRSEGDWFAIQSQHTELENLVFRGTSWSKSWNKSLARLPGAIRKKVRIAGITKDAVQLPMLPKT